MKEKSETIKFREKFLKGCEALMENETYKRLLNQVILKDKK